MDGNQDLAAEFAKAQRRHRRRMLVVVAAVAVAALAGGALVYRWTRPGPEVPPIARAHLWEVTGGGAPAPSYLFGTLHVGYVLSDLPPVVLAAQDRAAINVTESDLVTVPEAPAVTATHGGRSRLDDRQWARLAQQTRFDEAELVTWNTSQLMGAAMLAAAPGPGAMDRLLQERAAAQGKELVFLETRKLEALMDDDVLLDAVEQMIANPRLLRAEMVKMMRRYASGAEEGCGSAGAIDDLKTGLNADWDAGIEAQVRRGGAFVAIGCGHLVGPGSAVERLRAKGFQVQRIDRLGAR